MAKQKKVNPEKLLIAKEKAKKKEINSHLKNINALLVKIQKLMSDEIKPILRRKKRNTEKV
jgi:hypothetical protein